MREKGREWERRREIERGSRQERNARERGDVRENSHYTQVRHKLCMRVLKIGAQSLHDYHSTHHFRTSS